MIWYFCGPVAQLVRASAWHAEGRRFESDRVHHEPELPQSNTVHGRPEPCYALVQATM